MKTLFRVDASTQIGTGHVMRCLTLARELEKQGHQIYFISRELNGHMCNFIKKQGYKVYILPKMEPIRNEYSLRHAQWLQVSWKIDAQQTIDIIRKNFHHVNWIIVDHYALDIKWELEIKEFTQYVMVIDDLADRLHKCDMLLDQNYFKNMDQRYKGLVPKYCKVLTGPEYGLLRPEFLNRRESLRDRANIFRTILVFFGGSDPTHETYKVIKALEKIDFKSFCIDVVVGQSNIQKNIIQDLCRKHSNMNFHYQINYMSKLMSEADIAICAGGSTTWERYCLGLPAILISVADNQIEVCEAVNSLGIDWYIGKSEEVYKKDIITALQCAKEEFDLINRSKKALKIVDGHGANRVANEILKYGISLN